MQLHARAQKEGVWEASRATCAFVFIQHACIHAFIQWSFGITCWEVMCTGRLPYPTIDPVDMLKYLEQGHRLEKPTNSAAASEMYVDLKIYLLLSIW